MKFFNGTVKGAAHVAEVCGHIEIKMRVETHPGLDAIEEADRRRMHELGIPPQYLSPAPALRSRTPEAHSAAVSLPAA